MRPLIQPNGMMIDDTMTAVRAYRVLPGTTHLDLDTPRCRIEFRNEVFGIVIVESDWRGVDLSQAEADASVIGSGIGVYVDGCRLAPNEFSVVPLPTEEHYELLMQVMRARMVQVMRLRIEKMRTVIFCPPTEEEDVLL